MEQDATDQVLIGDLGVLYDARGYLAARRGDYETALSHYDRAFEIAEMFVPEVLASLEVQVYLTKIHLHYGEALAALGRPDEALERFRRTVRVGEAAFREDAVRRLGNSDLAAAHARVASGLLVDGPDADACAEATAALNQSRGI